MKAIRVQGSPSYYACEENVYDRIEDLLVEGRVKKALLLHGEKSWEAARDYLPAFTEVAVSYERYQGECSLKEIERVAHMAGDHESDVIIGLGGGKVMDIAKAAANELNIPVMLLPTLASTCAAWTPLSVIYTEQGDYLRYQPYIKNPWVVLVEPQIIAHSPAAYLRAGIGDTLAKWYEAKALTKTLPEPRVPVMMSLKAAQVCRDVILAESEEALSALGEQRVTPSLLAIMETSILAGGLVGGLGDEYGRIAAAHSVHNGLTQFEETHSFLHGEKVAYGILVQVALEKQLDELQALLSFYEKINLPSSLGKLGLQNNQETLEKLAAYTLAEGESIHFMEESFSLEEVVSSIHTVEAYKKIENK